MKNNLPFGPADILLPKDNYEKWSVIACDQFTSEPEYWKAAEAEVGNAPSALNIMLPEVYLGAEDIDGKIGKINSAMEEYLAGGIFEEYKNAMVLTERTIPDGRVRRGIVGAFELSAYSYEIGSKSPIRPTEGTVLSRIPPRVGIRRDAPLEMPHIMILIDDKKLGIIEAIDTNGLRKLYDFELMLGGGHLVGYLLTEKEQAQVLSGIEKIREGLEDGEMLFAVGDGNHSLATAKACSLLSDAPEAGYALAELVNIHSPALDFEPIYRIVTGINTEKFISEIKNAFAGCNEKKVKLISASGITEFYVNGLETDVLQSFIDGYIAENGGGSVDYIHGEDSLAALAAKPDSVGLLFDGITKDELFPYVNKNGVLPRKTFSMGEAKSKRYYTEARRIK